MKKKIFLLLVCVLDLVIGVFIGKKIFCNECNDEKSKIDKFKKYYNVLNKWLYIRNHEFFLNSYFEEKGLNDIAVYGMGELGYRLMEELKNTDVNVRYCIDKNSGLGYGDVQVKNFDEDFESVDAVVVTPIFDFKEIEKKLQRHQFGVIISLEDIVEDVAEEIENKMIKCFGRNI